MIKSLLVLLGLVLLAAACSGQHGRAEGTHGAWNDDNYDGDNMEQQQKAMTEAVKVMSNYDPATTPRKTIKRAVAMMNGAVTPLRPIFKAISRMPETTAAEVRAKDEARAAANEPLSRHLGQLLPGGSIEMSTVEM
ncbi:unnamed protein product [Alopecurus aequalis]